MSEWLSGSNVTILALAVIAGMVIGGLCVEALRRRKLIRPNPLWNIVAFGGGIGLGGTLLGGCILFLGGAGSTPPPAETLIPCPIVTEGVGIQVGVTPCTTAEIELTLTAQGGLATDTPTPRSTNTPRPTATEAIKPSATTRATDTPTATVTPTATPALPATFNLTLSFTPDAGGCGFGASAHPYSVAIDGSSMALTQVDAGITSTGTFDPVTGSFSVSVSGLPGTETYTGIIAFDGTTISLTGNYSYGNDPNLPCTATSSLISGTTTVP